MRSVFDQYEQPENQLTHALASSLAEDPRLLKRFIREVAGTVPPRTKQLAILEQQLPGEDIEYSEEEKERRGLPDAWIHDGDSWALLIENKVQASLTQDQLRRHMRVAARKGFTDVRLLVIGIKPPKFQMPRMIFRAWTELYQWLSNNRESEWALRAAQYFEVWEGNMVASDRKYLTEGTVTKFAGIPFGEKEPYHSVQAKRILKLGMNELRKRRKLQMVLGIDLKGAGRGAITGSVATTVWDFLPLKWAKGSTAFTNWPHFSFCIDHENLNVQLTIPDKIKGNLRRHLLHDGKEFNALLWDVHCGLQKALRRVPNASPFVHVMQRHFPSRISRPVMDGIVEFDLRAAFPLSAAAQRRTGVRYQKQWLGMAYDLMTKKRSNIEMAIGVRFRYDCCDVVKTAEILDHVEKSWLAFSPIINKMFKNR